MISIKVTVMAVALVTLCVLATNTRAAYIGCCRKYTPGKIRFQDIKGFSVQRDTEGCPINAIIFHTKNGKRCVNPAQEWVIDYVNRLEYMAQKVHETSRRNSK